MKLYLENKSVQPVIVITFRVPLKEEKSVEISIHVIQALVFGISFFRNSN